MDIGTIEVIFVVLGVIISFFAILLTFLATLAQGKITQQQMYLAMYEKFVSLENLDVDTAHREAWQIITRNLNTCELIAVAWDNKFVNRKVLRKMHREPFMDIFNQILSYNRTKHPDFDIDTKVFVERYAPTAHSVYKVFKSEIEKEQNQRKNKKEEYSQQIQRMSTKEELEESYEQQNRKANTKKEM